MNRQEIIITAHGIAQGYVAQGLRLTVRQLYYQFVARDLLPNGQKTYKRIVAALTAARLEGRFPFEWIEDRGRRVGLTDASQQDNMEDAIDNAADSVAQLPYWLRYGRWYGQPRLLSVWVEKEALSGVLMDPCNNLSVGLFACKGYPSVSALKSWVDETHAAWGEDTEIAIILYLGDHDPDGLQIPISAAATLRQIQHVTGKRFPFLMKRIALTMDQIDEYNPPPFGAKMTSARYQAYVDETGTTDAWELDALDPIVLQQLVRDNVNRLFDKPIHANKQEEIKALRLDMVERLSEIPLWDDDFVAAQSEEYMTAHPDWFRENLRRNI